MNVKLTGGQYTIGIISHIATWVRRLGEKGKRDSRGVYLPGNTGKKRFWKEAELSMGTARNDEER